MGRFWSEETWARWGAFRKDTPEAIIHWQECRWDVGGKLTWDYIELCKEMDRCIQRGHFDRPAVPLPEPRPEGLENCDSTLACEECWPKKKQRRRGVGRRRIRLSLAAKAQYPNERRIDAAEWEARWGDLEVCVYCSMPPDGGRFCSEHVVPLARGGSDNYANKVPACADCNSRKGTKLLWAEWVPPDPCSRLLAYFPPNPP